MANIETEIVMNQAIENTAWRLSFESTVGISEPVRITKNEIKSGSRLSVWNQRLEKRQTKLEIGITRWTEKYGEDRTHWPEVVKEKLSWREQLIEKAKTRIGYWSEINKETGEKIQDLFGGSIQGVEKLLISQPEKDKDGNSTGKNKFYTGEMRDAGGYKALFIVEQPEDVKTVGTISPTIYIDRTSGKVWILTENDGQAKVQKDSDPNRCMRAVRASVNNPLFKTANSGEVSATGYINAARIKGLVTEKYSAIFEVPDAELTMGKLVEIPDGKGATKQVFYKVMSLSEYSKSYDIPGKAAVLDALMAIQEQGSIFVHIGMPQVRK